MLYGGVKELTLRDVEAAAAWLAVVCCVIGFTESSAVFVSGAAAVIGFAFVLHDVRRLDQRAIEPVTLFALGFAVTGVANTMAVLSIAKLGILSPFALYLRVEYVFLATCLHLVGGVATIVGYRVIGSSAPARLVAHVMPRVALRSSPRTIATGGALVALLGFSAGVIPISRAIGAIGTLINLAPAIVIFLFARFGASRRQRGFVIAAVGLACIDAVQAALFAYLRSEILVPIIALLLGVTLGSRSLRSLRTKYLLPAYAGIAFFLVYFSALGVVRGASGGERLHALSMQEASAATTGDPRKATLMARLSNVNQLSQVGALVNNDGFMDGETLSYLGFAFIPRILWPSKPTIAKGQWFAFKIGQARLRPDGSYTNSVNMTVPGELYLNYGWLGAILGSLLFGAILAVFWSKALFWSDAHNALGTAYGFYLLWVSLGLGADLQIIVTLTATYIVFALLSAGAVILPGSSRIRPTHAAAVRPVGSSRDAAVNAASVP